MSSNPNDPTIVNPETIFHVNANYRMPGAIIEEFDYHMDALVRVNKLGADDHVVTAGVNKMFAVRKLGAAMPERESEPDGPIREPGDDMPSVGDVYSAGELAAALNVQAAKLAKRHGYYEIAGELNAAADMIETQAEQLDIARDKVAELVAEISELNDDVADKQRRIDSLNFAVSGMKERSGM